MTTAHDEHIRLERDPLGECEVPADAYYGIHTVRAMSNFPVTGIPIATHSHMVWALAAVKEAAAFAHRELGTLDRPKADAIIAACREIRDGKLREQFTVDVLQGGAGTSTNMNANEVIANRALEILGKPRGDYQYVHPLDDVNAGQSTNDVYPTAARIALDRAVRELIGALSVLRDAFAERADEFADVLKVGRTQLQDAVPMTVGRELAAYAVMIEEDECRLDEACNLLHEVNLGGTAIGTGLNSYPGYGPLGLAKLAEITDLPLVASPDLVEATQDCGVFVHLSGVVKRVALTLSKTCNDLRLLSSGPRAGLAEIHLPPVQAGSTMMPGKVNPVIPELVNQVAFEIVGDDATVTMAAEAGQLQLNAFEPVMVHHLLSGLPRLSAAARLLNDRCVSGISLNREQLHRSVESSIGIATALTPYLGYARSAEVAQLALRSGCSVVDIVVEQGLLNRQQLAEVLSADRVAGLKPRVATSSSELHCSLDNGRDTR